MEHTCYFCKEKAELEVNDDSFIDSENVKCTRCGRYRISLELKDERSHEKLPDDDIAKISGWIREHQEELITTDKLKEILKSKKLLDEEKGFKLLRFFAEHYGKGKAIDLNQYHHPPYLLLSVAWAKDLPEVLYLIRDYLVRNKGFLRYLPPGNSAAVVITTEGWEYIESGGKPTAKDAEQAIKVEFKDISFDELHPLIVDKCKKRFDNELYDDAIFNAMKVVEVEVRAKAGLPEKDYGDKLMNVAMKRGESKLIFSEHEGEQDAAFFLYSGALRYFKNPLSHRFVEHIDPMTVFEHLALASLLLRMLDETESKEDNPQLDESI